MSQPPIDDEQIRERQTYTASAGDDDERVSRRVVYEHSASTGGSRNFGVTIAIIVAIALALVGYILMHMHH